MWVRRGGKKWPWGPPALVGFHTSLIHCFHPFRALQASLTLAYWSFSFSRRLKSQLAPPSPAHSPLRSGVIPFHLPRPIPPFPTSSAQSPSPPYSPHVEPPQSLPQNCIGKDYYSSISVLKCFTATLLFHCSLTEKTPIIMTSCKVFYKTNVFPVSCLSFQYQTSKLKCNVLLSGQHRVDHNLVIARSSLKLLTLFWWKSWLTKGPKKRNLISNS